MSRKIKTLTVLLSKIEHWSSFLSLSESNMKSSLQALTIDSSSAVKVKGLTIRNSQQMHFVISRCESVRLSDIQISAPGDSPNTDGIHITRSTNVVLQNCKIGTGTKISPYFFLSFFP